MTTTQDGSQKQLVDSAPPVASSRQRDHAGAIINCHVQDDAEGLHGDVEAEAERAIFPLATGSAWERRLRWALVAVDGGALCIAVGVTYMLRLWASGRAYNDDIVAASLVPAWVLLLSVTGAYDGWRIGSAGEEVRRIITAGLRTAGLVAVASYGLQLHLSRLFLIAAISSGTVAVLAGRGAVRLGLHRLRRDGRCVHRVVVAGHAPDVQHLVEQSQRASSAGFRVVAACVPGKADWLPLIDGGRLPVLGEPVDVGTVSRAAGADVVAVASDSVLGRHEMRRLAWELEGTDTRLLVAPRLTDVAGPRISVRPLAGLPLLNVDQPRFSGINRAMKGVIDRTVAAVAIILLLPLLLVVVVAIRLGSRGRALFCQERAGLDGTPFTCWKLRSMVHDADRLRGDVEHLNHHPGGVLFKAPGDPRITRVGRWLRRTSVDELPQLWNVLRGQMSLVGPRPPLMTEVDAYEQDVRRRLLVKPGLTGLWQVSGRSDLSWEESVRLDLFYVENWSLTLDIAIIARTFVAICSRRGAY